MTEDERNEFRNAFLAVKEFRQTRLNDHDVAKFLLDLDRRISALENPFTAFGNASDRT